MAIQKELTEEEQNQFDKMLSKAGLDRSEAVPRLQTFSYDNGARVETNLIGVINSETLTDRISEKPTFKFAGDELEDSIAVQKSLRSKIRGINTDISNGEGNAEALETRKGVLLDLYEEETFMQKDLWSSTIISDPHYCRAILNTDEAAVVSFEDYAVTDRRGEPEGIWKENPTEALSSVATARAYREKDSSFAKIFTVDEMANKLSLSEVLDISNELSENQGISSSVDSKAVENIVDFGKEAETISENPIKEQEQVGESRSTQPNAAPAKENLRSGYNFGTDGNPLDVVVPVSATKIPMLQGKKISELSDSNLEFFGKVNPTGHDVEKLQFFRAVRQVNEDIKTHGAEGLATRYEGLVAEGAIGENLFKSKSEHASNLEASHKDRFNSNNPNKSDSFRTGQDNDRVEVKLIEPRGGAYHIELDTGDKVFVPKGYAKATDRDDTLTIPKSMRDQKVEESKERRNQRGGGIKA